MKKQIRDWYFRRCQMRTAFNAAIDCKTELLKLLNLPADATDEQIAAELTKLNGEAEKVAAEKAAAEKAAAETAEADKEKSTAANAALTQAQKALADAQAAAGKVLATAVNSVAHGALTTGRITGADLEQWRGKLTADFVGATAELDKLTPAFNTTPLHLKSIAAVAVPADVAARSTAYNAAIATKRRELNCDDATAEAALKTCPQHAALWAAVNQSPAA